MAVARGKQAVESARRRYDTAIEHIDRLTEELANEKLRRKEAEARATRLEALDLMVRNAELRHDEAISDTQGALHEWARIWKEDSARATRAMREVGKMLQHIGVMDLATPLERVEFLAKEYPAITACLTLGGSERWGVDDLRLGTSRHHPAERRLTGDRLKRFQRLMGERSSLGDSGVDWADLFDARQAGFTAQEAVEYSTTDPEAATAFIHQAAERKSNKQPTGTG
jgi:hypothetical protein